MPRFLIMNRDEFLAEILEEQKKKDVPVHERVGEYLAYEAACFLLNGPEKEAGAEDKIHTTAADELVKKLKTLGIMEYAKKCYTKVSQHVRPHYEYFLNQVMDRIVLDGFLSPNQVAERKAQLKTKLQTIRPNYADFWEENTKKPELAEPYKHRDRFTYEYEADQDSWKLFVAGNRLLGRSAGYPVSDQEVASVKKSATSQLLMRNKRTVEKLKRGELEEVKEEMLKLRRSFKFANRDTLGRAQADTIPLLEEMKIYHSGVAASNEWRQLLKAVEAFNQENDPVKAIDLSANVLVAVEKFTKGKKSKQSNMLTQTCVDLALRALSDCVPDAKNNPSVKPLIDRFNTVR
ncbi:MAG: hypothetical protein J6P72_06485 [Firmicutes bacterium]|nr:hypothetical protein [Bacillota bacterium]